MAVAGAIPAVARNLVRFADPAGGENDCFGAKNFEAAALAIITEGGYNALGIFKQCEDANLHMHIDTAVNAVILQRADHFEAGAIPDVRKPGIFVTAKISLQNAAVLCSIEHRAPSFELAHTIGRS